LLQLIFGRGAAAKTFDGGLFSFCEPSLVLCSLFFSAARRASYCDAPKSPFLFLRRLRGKALRKKFYARRRRNIICFLTVAKILFVRFLQHAFVRMGAVKNRAPAFISARKYFHSVGD
jgi:hypothetical protein